MSGAQGPSRAASAPVGLWWPWENLDFTLHDVRLQRALLGGLGHLCLKSLPPAAGPAVPRPGCMPRSGPRHKLGARPWVLLARGRGEKL